MARQAIPRPVWARRVEGPGGGLQLAGGGGELTIGAVRDAFAIAPPSSEGESLLPGAAVLIVLAPLDDRGDASPCSVVLTRRALQLRANPGEIAFPGGRIEPGESPLAAAFREAGEEVALSDGVVEVLGELPIVLASRRFVPVLPFVAVAQAPPVLEANSAEVDGVLVVALKDLVAPGRYWREQWDRGEDPAWTMHFFDLGEDLVWGATARMLYELFVRLFSRECGGRTGGPPGERTPPASRWTRAAM